MVFSSHMTQRASARRVVGIRLYVLCRKLFFLRGPVQLGGAVHPSDRDEKAFRLLPAPLQRHSRPHADRRELRASFDREPGDITFAIEGLPCLHPRVVWRRKRDCQQCRSFKPSQPILYRKPRDLLELGA